MWERLFFSARPAARHEDTEMLWDAAARAWREYRRVCGRAAQTGTCRECLSSLSPEVSPHCAIAREIPEGVA